MCFYGDAENWSGLGHIASTDVLAPGASTIIVIEEYGTATSIVISYDNGSSRYIFFANELNESSCTMTGHSSTKSYYSYSRNNIKVGILSKYDGKWIIKLTNNTGSDQSFYYNQKMCFTDDAKNWTGLSDVAQTNVLRDGASTILEIAEYGTATDIVITYTSNYKRYIFYANNLSTSGSMSSYSSSKPFYTYAKQGMEVSIIGKNAAKWLIEIVNKTGDSRSFEYNQRMCFEGDAKNWNGLKHIVSTLKVANGASYIIEIEEYLTATSIAISYTDGNQRNIFYAYNLNESGTMSCYGNTSTTYSYTQKNITVGIVGKNGNKWLLNLTNNTGKEMSFYYNSKMCNFDDAKNWAGLADISKTAIIANGDSIQIEISEYSFATSIAISYIDANTRYIFYANQLNVNGTLTPYGSSKSYTSYVRNGIKVSIAGKTGSTWLIELTNNTGKDRRFYYNRNLCFADDAKYWNGLSHESNIDLENGNSKQIKISENGTATSIAISYLEDDDRTIFYAYDLDPSGTMTSFGNKTPTYYINNGMEVAILSKSGYDWTIKLTNRTGAWQRFAYNSKMCFEGDAKNWKLDADVRFIELENRQSAELTITENWSATSIAISYMSGNIRKIFYAYDLDAVKRTMTPFGVDLDTTQTPDSCLAAGSMITLADGSQKAVEDLAGDETLLVWNLYTGSFDYAPIVFIDSEPIGHYDVIKLSFSDDTTVDVVYEHGFWDADLNKYVYLDKDASNYIGHSFIKQDGSQAVLENVEISTEITTVYSPVTYGHLCYYVNGMLSMPGGIDGLFNIFEVDGDTLCYDMQKMAADIEEYGLFAYEEFTETYPVSEDVFNAFNGRYLKVAIGKGLITPERIGDLINRYADFFN